MTKFQFKRSQETYDELYSEAFKLKQEGLDLIKTVGDDGERAGGYLAVLNAFFSNVAHAMQTAHDVDRGERSLAATIKMTYEDMQKG